MELRYSFNSSWQDASAIWQYVFHELNNCCYVSTSIRRCWPCSPLTSLCIWSPYSYGINISSLYFHCWVLILSLVFAVTNYASSSRCVVKMAACSLLLAVDWISLYDYVVLLGRSQAFYGAKDLFQSTSGSIKFPNFPFTYVDQVLVPLVHLNRSCRLDYHRTAGATCSSWYWAKPDAFSCLSTYKFYIYRIGISIPYPFSSK